ncbi:heat shock protein 70-like protein [Guillardia theta CCMP2712]|uniref:Heat shock protein 70-like protein n=1 Tax=Guillardia theta (strain CCMP2712) TaxID=905079 RepID=L1IHZ3_GUITC|nr:heat shock protein 70-like protein [Guillardia theta CCMP2712]EKX35722.1 heat shock protein 70-like protein [Guillardia theta CCMP2712]|eukprot:XP_005822702.1 heat shock protein 70-like protein [Guillardia theta CCMP2712]
MLWLERDASQGQDAISVLCKDERGMIEKISLKDLTAMLVTELLSSAMGEEVQKEQLTAVMAVPELFNDMQKEFLQDVLKRCGIAQGVEFVTEPVAIGKAYGYERKAHRRLALTVNFGAMALRVSLLKLEDHELQVLDSLQDFKTSGREMDKVRLTAYETASKVLFAEYQACHGVDLRDDKELMFRVLVACDDAKRVLCSEEQTTIEVDQVDKARRLKVHMTRQKMEELCEDIYDRVLALSSQLLGDNSVRQESIADVLVAGGCCEIKAVQDKLRSMFRSQLNLPAAMPMDHVVLEGVCAHMQQLEERRSRAEKGREEREEAAVSLSIGIEVQGGIMHKLIQRGTSLPCHRSEDFSSGY